MDLELDRSHVGGPARSRRMIARAALAAPRRQPVILSGILAIVLVLLAPLLAPLAPTIHGSKGSRSSRGSKGLSFQ